MERRKSQGWDGVEESKFEKLKRRTRVFFQKSKTGPSDASSPGVEIIENTTGVPNTLDATQRKFCSISLPTHTVSLLKFKK